MATTATTSSAPLSHEQNDHIHAPHQRRPRAHGHGEFHSQASTATDSQPTHNPSVRGSRGGRGGRPQAAKDRSLAFRPATVVPSRPQSASSSTSNAAPATNTTDSQAAVQNGTTLNTRGGGRGRGRGGRGGARGLQHSIVQSRQFGGALTQPVDEDEDVVQVSALQADAPVFQPGQSFQQTAAPRQPKRQAQPRQRRPSKSTAPDIATRIHEDINNRQYECPICTSEVLNKSKVWNCKKCWTVFHLDCIKKWSNNADSGVTQPRGQDGENIVPRQWRCPGCNLPQETKPTSYNCWCGKEHEPRSLSGIPPHSCGQTCGKSREIPKKCPHPCELLCHAGPCPPCTHMGPTQRCFCGKEAITRRCVETHYDGGWSCGKICDDVMPCGEHTCQRPCHEGLCGSCEVRVDARCYCGQEEKEILCCDRDDDKDSARMTISEDGEKVVEHWTGQFQCTKTCDRFFDCGKHQCSKPCHAQGEEVAHCPRSPDVVIHCPCGKTELGDISDRIRESCEESIPNCSKVCMKLLPCGHPCQQTCHVGECFPCLEKVIIQCRCGRTESTSICHQGSDEAPQCTRVCHTTLNCGRHECGERCCPGEKKAGERQSSKRKQRPLSSSRPIDDGFEAEHICTRPCGRLLKCGNHLCEELCHRGPCGSCREALFDEISCHCGRTVLQQPLPCGTEPPPCRFDCERRKACGHPQVPHNCHFNDVSCPKCPFLTEKPCLCGKKSLKNQQCWFTDVRCGEICGRKLKCGSHTCRKTCHKAGECEDAVGSCQQACGKEKKCCGHPDEDICHAPYPCKEEKPCTHKLIITCDCQHHKQEMRCNASRTNEGNTKKTLKCDDECARLERNRKLALALNINQETHKDEFIPYSTETLNMFLEHPKWSQEQEREFRVFATDDSEKRLRFKPMTATQRAFLHSLAEDFGFDSESMDPEPHRHVALFKSPRFVSAPNKTLRESVRIRQSQQQVAAAEALAATAKAKSSLVNEPYNGFLLTQPRFALTIDELTSELAAVQGPQPKLVFRTKFLADGDVALKATLLRPAKLATNGSNERSIDMSLKELRHPLARAFNSHNFGTLQLCRFDESLAPLRREADSVAEGGWSQVAAKAAVPKGRVPVPGVTAVGAKSSFTVLGSGGLMRKKLEKERKEKRGKEEVVDDWEIAEGEAEEKELEQEKRRSGEFERQVVGGGGDGAKDESMDSMASQTGVEEKLHAEEAVAISSGMEASQDTSQATIDAPVEPSTAPAGEVDLPAMLSRNSSTTSFHSANSADEAARVPAEQQGLMAREATVEDRQDDSAQ